MNITQRFIEYCKIDTTSLDDAQTVPSTDKQFNLLNLLHEQVKQMGLSNIVASKHCYLYATLPANTQCKTKLGFVAHVDTSNAVSGTNVKPIVHLYEGGDIVLKHNTTIKLADNPQLSDYIGQHIVTASGDTLLGADDKAGIAIIMETLQYYLDNPTVKHGQISICFTPDEEVGRGTDFFDIKQFDADVAYTVDGGLLGEIEYENFNAAAVTINIDGKSFHPGTSYNKMVNSIIVFNQLANLLPIDQTPSTTKDYQGFFHWTDITGSVEKLTASMIIRDHDKKLFEDKKQFVADICKKINAKYGYDVINVTIKDSYYNMKEMILPHFHLITNAEKAMKARNITPQIIPIRGGTDGCKLSYQGLPCPNLACGGNNYHGKEEYVVVESMEKMSQTLVEIVKLYCDD